MILFLSFSEKNKICYRSTFAVVVSCMEKYDMRGVEFLFVAKSAHYKYSCRCGTVRYSTPHPPEGRNKATGSSHLKYE